MKRALSILIALVLVFTALSASASAVTADYTATGVATEGTTDHCSWTLDMDGTLTLNGSGATDFHSTFRFTDSRIKTIVIGEGVTAIGNDLFTGCNNATGLSLPSTLAGIGDRAFIGCTGLTEVTMPASLRTIGSQAFSDCTGLSSVTLNDGLETVDFRAFANTALTEVTVPATVTTIGSQAFGIRNYSAIDGFTVRGAADSAAEEYAAYYAEDGMIFAPVREGNTFVLAGSGNWLNSWTPSIDEYVMTKRSDGVYTITVPHVPATPAGENYSLKVVEFSESAPVWHGLDGGNLNVDFRLRAAGDVTVTYNPATKEITVTGPPVTLPVYDIKYITAVGDSGGATFLNGVSWDPAAQANRMTEVSKGVYEITYKNVSDYFDYQVKFAANGSWDINWGAESDEMIALGAPLQAVYDGYNIHFEIDEESDVTLRLDLRGMNWMKKTGAVITVMVGEPGEIPPFEESLLGDVDKDGKVDIFDASAIQKGLARMDGYVDYASADKTGLDYRIADVDGNGNVDIFDASLIQKWLAKYPSAMEYPIGEPLAS